MKKLLFAFALSACANSYAADQAATEKSASPQRFPMLLKSRMKPAEADSTASKYIWLKDAHSDSWTGSLKVAYWDRLLVVSKISRRMSIEGYSKPE
jgi:hypothetical protein